MDILPNSQLALCCNCRSEPMKMRFKHKTVIACHACATYGRWPVAVDDSLAEEWGFKSVDHMWNSATHLDADRKLFFDMSKAIPKWEISGPYCQYPPPVFGN